MLFLMSVRAITPSLCLLRQSTEEKDKDEFCEGRMVPFVLFFQLKYLAALHTNQYNQYLRYYGTHIHAIHSI